MTRRTRLETPQQVLSFWRSLVRQPLGTPDSGLTLIECLVAIIVIALVASAITPTLVIAVATRVQSQRAEQALEVAQSEIDRVRLMMERGQDETGASLEADDLPPAVASTALSSESTPAAMEGPTYGAPTVLCSTPSYDDSLTPTDACTVDVDGDSDNDFAVQIFRTPGRFRGTMPVSFYMGVRVYDIDAITASTSGNLETDPAGLGFTSSDGERGSKPLAALYTQIGRAEEDQSLCDYIDYLSTTNGNNTSTPVGCD